MWFQTLGIPVLSPASRYCQQCGCNVWERAELQGSWPLPLLLCSLRNGDWQIFASSPLGLHPTLGLVTGWACSSGKNTVSVVSVLGFADNVLSNPTLTATASSGACQLERVRGSKLWEKEGRHPVFIALFLYLECWLPGHWVQLQHLLVTPSVMLIVSLCFSQLNGMPVQPDSSSFQAETYNDVHELWVVCLQHHLSSSVPPPGFAPTCPSSYVSMRRSLRWVCVLSRESFVESQLFKQFKFQ